ncbi:MAG: class D sortase [Anaerolineae bacterium]|nr:class D sortase [Anaerolineae bacterium]
MKDHRYVDELSIEELERLVHLRKRQERLKRLSDNPDAADPEIKAPASSGAVRNPSLPPNPKPVAVANSDRSSAAVVEVVAVAGTQPVPNPALRLPLGQDPPTAPPGRAALERYSAVVETGSRRRQRRPIKWRWIRDQALLLVEILAVLGLVWVVLQMVTTVNQINEESRNEMVLPTVTPTPMIRAVVLPGGHTPPDAEGFSEPALVPAHLRGLVAEVTPLPAPTLGAEHGRRIVIPAIGVDAPVVEGDDWESLKKGAGHTIGTVNPGERGNCVIAAHNDIYGEIFRRLPELTVDDEIVLETQSTSYRYVVEQTRIVSPKEVSVMDNTSTPVLTLISCYPYGVDTHRIVVIAALDTD